MKQYIVTEKGLREVNPYQQEGKDWHDYGHFETTVQYYATDLPIGSTGNWDELTDTIPHDHYDLIRN